MSIEQINIGNVANDGTGDNLRDAFLKVNNNFIEVERVLDTTSINVQNLGTAGEGVFSRKEDDVLFFKEILAGENVTISSNNNSVIINSTGGVDEILVLSDNGSIVLSSPVSQISASGNNGIKTRANLNNLFIELDDSGIVEADNSPRLSASLNANGYSIINADKIIAQEFQGNLNGTVKNVDIDNINRYFSNNWDFGNLADKTYTSFLDIVFETIDVDLSSIVRPADFEIDLGNI
jgi:hypothetical protein